MSKIRDLKKIFIANRGEIACRAIRPCRELGIKTAVGYSDCDILSMHVKLADDAIYLGPSPATHSYLNIEKVIMAAKKCNADAIFPGYGFLSENPDFAQACLDENIVFIGPPPLFLKLAGDKVKTRLFFKEAGIPVIPGLDYVKDLKEIENFGEKFGWPIMLKASFGGGGKGIKKVNSSQELESAISSVISISKKAFGNENLYVEKFIPFGKHIEIQYISDQYGNIIHLGERECSIQRHHQKLIEEAPSDSISKKLREKMGDIVCSAIKRIGYVCAGTMEFIVDEDENFYAIEINPRIQVEHTVTEMITGFDIIRKMIKVSSGQPLGLKQEDVILRGHAIQCRVNAEDPKNNFAPSYGKITYLHQISGPFVRAESGIYQGWVVPPYYDSLLCKLCSVGKDRATAIERMKRALSEFEIRGIKTTLPLLKRIISHPDFLIGKFDTTFIERRFKALTDYTEEEDEVYKIARFLAEITAFKGNQYCL